MVRVNIKKANFFALANAPLLRGSSRHSHHSSQKGKFVGSEEVAERNKKKAVMEMNWVPHRKSGIYYPEGQNWVMDDLPSSAATLGQAQPYWLRNIDGVDKYDPDVSSADQYLLTS